MFEEHRIKIKEASLKAYPEEAVFLITSDGKCTQVDNIADDPRRTFSVRKIDVNEAMAIGLEAVVHSHPDGDACPSEADMQTQINFGVPFGIVATDGVNCTNPFYFGDQCPIPDIENRIFRSGVTDCYSLLRDFYRQEFNILLKQYPRDWAWWEQGKNLYMDNWADNDFFYFDAPIEYEPQRGDVWLAQLRSDTPNHAGIYLGDGLVIHHTSNKPVDITRIPTIEPANRWKPHITHWLRHRDLHK